MPEFKFHSLVDFIAMGGYAFYVWTAYAFFAVVMALNLWLAYRQRAQVLRLLQARQLRQQAASAPASAVQQSAQQQ